MRALAMMTALAALPALPARAQNGNPSPPVCGPATAYASEQSSLRAALDRVGNGLTGNGPGAWAPACEVSRVRCPMELEGVDACAASAVVSRRDAARLQRELDACKAKYAPVGQAQPSAQYQAFLSLEAELAPLNDRLAALVPFLCACMARKYGNTQASPVCP